MRCARELSPYRNAARVTRRSRPTSGIRDTIRVFTMSPRTIPLIESIIVGKHFAISRFALRCAFTDVSRMDARCKKKGKQNLMQSHVPDWSSARECTIMWFREATLPSISLENRLIARIALHQLRRARLNLQFSPRTEKSDANRLVARAKESQSSRVLASDSALPFSLFLFFLFFFLSSQGGSTANHLRRAFSLRDYLRNCGR